MPKKPEQIDQHERRTALKRATNRQTVRAARREVKRDPENAPKKRAFNGYTG